MTSLDTNVILRFLLDDVPEQTKKAAAAIEQNTVYVTDVVIAEVIFVLEKVFRLSHPNITELVNDFLGLSNVFYNQHFLGDSIDLYCHHPALSFVDCYAAAEAQAYGNRLVTFDKRLARQGGNHIKGL